MIELCALKRKMFRENAVNNFRWRASPLKNVFILIKITPTAVHLGYLHFELIQLAHYTEYGKDKFWCPKITSESVFVLPETNWLGFNINNDEHMANITTDDESICNNIFFLIFIQCKPTIVVKYMHTVIDKISGSISIKFYNRLIKPDVRS